MAMADFNAYIDETGYIKSKNTHLSIFERWVFFYFFNTQTYGKVLMQFFYKLPVRVLILSYVVQ